MATKQFYATRDFKYGTRMMRAGDPVEMTAPNARLYRALNAISPTKPKSARAAAPVEPVAEAAVAPAPVRKPAAKRKAPAKKKAK